MQKHFRENLLAALSVVGCIAAVYLSIHYYDIHGGTAGFKSICNINSTFDCDAVATSKFAQIFGLPLSSFVTGWFLTMLILSFLMRSTSWRREAIAIGTGMSIFGTLYSVFLLFTMTVLIKKFCLFCLVIDGVNFLQLGILLSFKEESFSARFKNLNFGKFQSAGILFVVLTGISLVLLRPAGPSQSVSADDNRYLAQQVLDAKVEQIKIPAKAMVMGSENAPITVVEFSDFQCPHCKRGALLMHTLQNKYPDQIKVVFMSFPLDSSCNRKLERPMHPYACALARAAYCAQQKGMLETVYQDIFDDQEYLNANSAHNALIAQRIDEEEAKKCIDSEDAKKMISDTIEEGIRLNVASTPSFFVNGKRVPEGGLTLEAWELVIEGLLKK